MRQLILRIAIGGCLIGTHVAMGAVSFTGLGFLPGGHVSSVTCMSADGTVLAGASGISNGTQEAFYWTAAGGMVGMGDLPGGTYDSGAVSMTADGSLVMCSGHTGTPSVSAPFFWTPTSGMITTNLPPVAGGLSADGTYVAAGASRWSAAGGAKGLIKNPFNNPNGAPPLPGNPGISGYFISADGNTIVGSTTGTPRTAFRWTALPTANISYLPLLDSDPGFNSQANDVSRDGNVTVGDAELTVNNFFTVQAVRWVGNSQVQQIPYPAGFDEGSAQATNRDGSVVVGELNHGESSADGFIWDATNGTRALTPYLLSLGIDLTGWSDLHPYRLSDDSLTIAGAGIHNGNNEAFVATVPEPAVLPLCASLLLLQARRRRKGKSNGHE